MSASKCPFRYMAKKASSLPPSSLNLKSLSPTSYLNNYNYANEFKSLDLAELKKHLLGVLTTSQDWWPADYGHYGPLMVRLAWHSAGTYRTFDGRGGANSGNMRFSPLDSWPDNGNLDKARRLLWPIKKKYGRKISWADLFILAGNVSMESMGFETFGFGGGRVDGWEPEADIYWGSETEMLADERHPNGVLEEPLAADHMGLIYVNPEGPGGVPDPERSAKHIRDTFGRMGMNDEETVALIAGGHTFGKGHGAAPPDDYVGPAPKDAPVELLGVGWSNTFKSGKGEDTITSGLEGAWTNDPIRWDNGYFHNLFTYEWVLTKGPGGAHQWTPKDLKEKAVPDAHNPSKKHAPVMFTTDVALKVDPIYEKISKHFYENPEVFREAFAKAWYKLTHRDMGPVARLVGADVPPPQLWQDPLPSANHPLIGRDDVDILKTKILQSGLSISKLVRTAWASASTFRVTDYRGGANGARIRLSPQKDWMVNEPNELNQILQTLEEIQMAYSKPVSLADLIVLGGCAAIEEAAGGGIKVPFTPGRTDAAQEDTVIESFDVLEPTSDGFRNYNSTSHQLVDRAHFLSLSPPEMTVLVGGLRVLGANTSSMSDVGVFTDRPQVLTNDFFANLIGSTNDDIQWLKNENDRKGGRLPLFSAYNTKTGKTLKWKASEVDLIFGSNSELRAIAEYYACDDTTFVEDFIKAWVKVMELDRFDLDATKRKEEIRSRL
uniref:Catalase-peroxidase n=1 Tax=Ditylum brightwellii TaxID=49249 RepID=A0A7S4VGA1_9STRA